MGFGARFYGHLPLLHLKQSFCGVLNKSGSSVIPFCFWCYCDCEGTLNSSFKSYGKCEQFYSKFQEKLWRTPFKLLRIIKLHSWYVDESRRFKRPSCVIIKKKKKLHKIWTSFCSIIKNLQGLSGPVVWSVPWTEST